MNDSATKTIRTVCLECRAQCGMLVQVKDGRVIGLKDDPSSPRSRDKLCWKAQAGLERLYHPDRLHYPLERTGDRGEGKWRRITWDEALTTIADRLNTIKKNDGAESVALIKGQYDRKCDLVSRLGNSFGTPNIAGIDNTCYIPSASGRLMTYGFDGRPDFTGFPDCVLCWGNSMIPPMKEGAKFIVVNAIQTEAARQADIWLRPRPGTDLALALGILNVIVNEKLYDKHFVDAWTTGFEELVQHIQSYPPDRVARITWVPEDKIIAAARLFSGFPSACLATGNASEDSYHSTQFARAASIIQAICGYLDIPGGTIEARGIPIDKEGSSADVLCDLLPPEQVSKKLGSEFGHFPVDPLWDTIVNKPAELQSQYLINAILDKTPYPIQAVLVIGCNPVMTWSNSKRVFKALQEVPFLAVAEMVMTPTACLADIVLPSASYLETDAVLPGSLGFGDTALMAQQKVVQIGECKPDLEIVIELANALGLGAYFWKDLPSYLDAHLEGVGITFDELRKRHRIIPSGVQYRKYLKKGFNTPSGKVEIVSSLCKKWGYEILPDYHEPKETPISEPKLAEEYPLILTSAHHKHFGHSKDRHLRTIRDKYPDPLVAIHPETAANLGISEGDQVYIENRRGRIKQTATLSEDVDPKVLNVAYGWWFPEKGPSARYGWDEANINILTDDSPPYSPEIGSPTMRGFLCRIYKVE